MAFNPFGPTEIYGYQTLWHTIGNYMARIEQYEKSLPFFDEAVLKCPNDKKTLIDRGKVRGKLCNFQGALEDINRAIKLDPKDLVSLAERSEAVYLSCEFEDAIIQNYRLLPLRQKPDHFSMGIRKCSTAIENCLGPVAGCPLRDYFLIIRKLAWLETFLAERRVAFVAKNKKIKKPKRKRREKKKTDGEETFDPTLQIKDSIYSHQSNNFRVPPLKQSYHFSPLQNYTTNIENYMAETYLERMYREKVFVKDILKKPGLNCPNQEGVKKLRTIAKDCYKTVYDKQEVLRTRKPFYNIKYQQAFISGNLKDRLEAELQLHQENTRKEAEKIVTRLEKALAADNLTAVVDLTEKLKKYCDSKSKRLLPDKQIYLSKIYDIIRDAFYRVNRLNPEQPRWHQDKRILVALGQPISREPSRDSVITSYRPPLLDFAQQIKMFEDRLEVAEDDSEMLWYYHELARYNLLAKKYEVAKSFCTRCILLAEKNNEYQWYINGTVLQMRICIKLMNKNDAIIEANKGIEMAKELHDKNLEKYLQRCILVISDLEFDDHTGRKQLQRRQEKILALMQSDKIKSEFSHLFRIMSAQPDSRRMNIIPGMGMKKSSSGPMKKQSLASRNSNRLSVLAGF
ncbi:outer dynein arm-docking complex subunit 4-like [Diabrotica virgifera virgifera]|uniref:Tetratricopeptide repeat protein 25-like n=2 Tax=Diabrotica virgifera virgifera TaxID=50390 RepID=A0ABM5JNZ6_DIAVI|nr:outer dynein arm-docking complex subunit 4-like [Diabrotica virgifera virgifera]